MDVLTKSIYINKLFDVYQDLLTEKQRLYVESYYLDDLSISEISENFEVSRNAAYDQIKRAVKKLEDFETKLQLLSKEKTRQELYKKLKKTEIKEVQEIVDELEKVE